MKKKLLSVLLALVCVTAAVPSVTALEKPVTIEAAAKKKAPTLGKVYRAVKNAYGEDYLPDVRLSKADVKTRYGIPSSWYSGVVAEIPMISVQVDELVIVKAKNASSKKKIKKALLGYQEKLKEDIDQYLGNQLIEGIDQDSANQLMIQASRVYVKGNYVCFIMLGLLSNEEEQQEESKVIAAYRQQNQKAVDAINELYK